jgi:hypothetical protein
LDESYNINSTKTIEYMDFNATKTQVTKELGNVKKAEDVFKLHWAYPLVAAIALWICKAFLLAHQGYVWAGVVLVGLAGIWTLVHKSNSKPNPLKVSWEYFLIPAAAVTAILIMPNVFGWVIGLLFLWALIAFLMSKPWEKW